MTDIKQSGSVTPGHLVSWTTDGVVQDAGVPGAANATQLGLLTASGTAFGIQNASAPSPYRLLGFGFNPTNGNAQITMASYGGASAAGIEIVLNGTTYPFPSLGPVPVNEIIVGQASGIGAAVTMSGDASIVASGAVTVGALGGKAVSLGGPMTISGAYSLTVTLTGITSITMPTSGTLATLGGTNTWTGTNTFNTPIAAGSGGTGLSGSAAANGSLLIGNGTGYSLATITGTASNLTVTNGAGSITLAATSKQMPGTATNDNASAGNLGEYISSTVLFGSAVSLTSNTPANVTSVSLTAGDWDVYGTVALVQGGSTNYLAVAAWTSTTSATLPTVPNNGGYVFAYNTGTDAPVTGAGIQRISLAVTTTVYLSVNVSFTGGSGLAYGFLGARRAR